jgi:large subunit ribosomal protein L17
MRHRKIGRKLGRSSSHRQAMLRNLARSLVLTLGDSELDMNNAKVKGRVTTTLHKAKEVRRLIERSITLACQALPHLEAAERHATGAERGTDEWKRWRNSDRWRQWAEEMSPVVATRRRLLRMLGDKRAVQILFSELAPRFAGRKGGYTRVLKLSGPRLGDSGRRAILEFVGVHDRIVARSEKPAFESSDAEPAGAGT